MSAIDGSMLKSAQNDLDVLEDLIATLADSAPLPVITSLIHEARTLIDTLQRECGS